LIKKSSNKIAFIWLAILVATIVYFPLFLYFWPKISISTTGWACVVATGILHALNFWLMGGAYTRGDLSLVYPLSRGTGPLLVPILAVLLINEQLAALGIFGILSIIVGIYIIHLRYFSLKSSLEPILALPSSASIWALCTGATIAGYSVVDKVGVSLVYPPIYVYLLFIISLLLLSPYVFLRHRTALKDEWQSNKIQIVIVGFLDLFTYLLVLFALKISKVSYVAAAREVSIVFSAILGILWLKEKNAPQKVVGAVLISLGVILIGLSR
jgi:uncharacterized membrane protein